MTTLKLAPLFAILGIVACESSQPTPSHFDPKNGASGTGDKRGDDVGDLGTGGEPPAAPTGYDTCATETASVESKPIYLVFIFDKSGSMVADNSPKWESAKAASKAFFQAQESTGVHASLTFFPDKLNYSCTAEAYAPPTVAMTALPSADFGKSLDQQFPNGDTPTEAALGGAIQYAKTVAANEAKDGRVAIVLVTDGIPDSTCNDNSVPAVAQLAASVAQTVPTYVIGVGNELTSLTQIAEGGGTKSAFIVNTNAPEQIQTDFLSAVNAIKLSAIACDYAIPPAPSGQTIDRNRVTVVHRVDMTANTLAYNPGCSGGAGWHYDDEATPRSIQLCDASCTTAKTTPGKLEVSFGCADQLRTVR